MYEIDITKWHGGVLILVETREKVMKKYGKNGTLSRSQAIANALEDSVKNVKLTKKELDAVRSEIEMNYKKRMKRREDHKNHIDTRTRTVKHRYDDV